MVAQTVSETDGSRSNRKIVSSAKHGVVQSIQQLTAALFHATSPPLACSCGLQHARIWPLTDIRPSLKWLPSVWPTVQVTESFDTSLGHIQTWFRRPDLLQRQRVVPKVIVVCASVLSTVQQLITLRRGHSSPALSSLALQQYAEQEACIDRPTTGAHC